MLPCHGDAGTAGAAGQIPRLALALIGTGEQPVPLDHRGLDIHPPEGLDGLTPEHLPVRRGHPAKLFAGLHQQLALPVYFGEDRGGEGTVHRRAVIFERAPHDFAVGFFQFAEGSTGLDVEEFPVHQRRADEAETRRRFVELTDEIHPPVLLARGAVERNQNIPHPSDEEILAIPSGRAAHPVPIFGREKGHALITFPLSRPHRLARGPVDRMNPLQAFVHALGREDEAVCDNRTRITGAQGNLPGGFQIGKIGWPSRAMESAGTVGPAPLRPICPGRGEGQQPQNCGRAPDYESGQMTELGDADRFHVGSITPQTPMESRQILSGG